MSLDESAEPVVVEGFDTALFAYCTDRGLRPNQTTDETQLCQCISDAAHAIVGKAPCCKASLAALVRTIHLVASGGDDYDTSYSDPSIPFSIFLSVPTAIERRSLLRVAEGLVHEAMHLQLSLCEAICPLVDGTVKWEMYSPWKQTKRQTQGVMHGLYVFCVLKWMWEQVGQVSSVVEDRLFAARRINEITDEIKAVRDVVDSPALTHEGRDFVQSLLKA